MISRLTKYWIKNILRNKFLSFSSILVLALLMFFINILFIIHGLSNTLIQSINSKLTISLYLKDEYSKENSEVTSLINDIHTKLKNIKVDFKTKDQVLESMREKDEELVQIISSNSRNPLPATITISNIWIDEYEALNLLIVPKSDILTDFKTDTKNETIYDYKSQYNRILKIIATLQTLKFALYVIIWVFLLSIFVINYSIIWNFIYHYRDEISITKLVWWSNIFIYWPFVVQSFFYSIIWFIISTSVFLIWLNNLSFIFDKNIIKSILWNNFIETLLIQLTLFILVCAYSSFLSSKKYIKI